jgi:hypothetical protein
MLNLSELVRGGTLCLSKAGLHKGTTNTIDIAAPNGAGVDFCIGGKLYHKPEVDTITVTACASQADLTSCLYLVQLDTAGTPAVTVLKGVEVLTANVGLTPLEWPVPTAGKCPIGGFRIDTGGAVFVAGTTTFDTANTATFYDFMAVPDAPIVA